jgi:hypothetical protein
MFAAEAGFLPRFVFPFVKLCGAKAEVAFEVVATLLLNWCSGWFELFPNPPLPLLRRFLVGWRILLKLHGLQHVPRESRLLSLLCLLFVCRNSLLISHALDCPQQAAETPMPCTGCLHVLVF